VTGSALLVHGLSSGPDGWWRVRAWLEEAGWSTGTVTLLGHGDRGAAADYSLDAYAADVRDSTGSSDLVVAHSLGGSIATVLAAEDAGWARRLILLDPVWYVPADELPATSAEQVAELSHTEQSLRAAKPHWDDRDIAAKLSAIASVDPDAVSRTFGEPASWALRDPARRIGVPTLVLGGDPATYTMLDPADGYEVAQDAPDMEYRILPGSGHSPHRDVPDATRAAITRWLAVVE
jgi:pimeloyl-ACP methyl ester carboxylesterase